MNKHVGIEKTGYKRLHRGYMVFGNRILNFVLANELAVINT